jgi:hypothetical protein
MLDLFDALPIDRAQDAVSGRVKFRQRVELFRASSHIGLGRVTRVDPAAMTRADRAVAGALDGVRLAAFSGRAPLSRNTPQHI